MNQVEESSNLTQEAAVVPKGTAGAEAAQTPPPPSQRASPVFAFTDSSYFQWAHGTYSFLRGKPFYFLYVQCWHCEVMYFWLHSHLYITYFIFCSPLLGKPCTTEKRKCYEWIFFLTEREEHLLPCYYINHSCLFCKNPLSKYVSFLFLV